MQSADRDDISRTQAGTDRTVFGDELRGVGSLKSASGAFTTHDAIWHNCRNTGFKHTGGSRPRHFHGIRRLWLLGTCAASCYERALACLWSMVLLSLRPGLPVVEPKSNRCPFWAARGGLFGHLCVFKSSQPIGLSLFYDLMLSAITKTPQRSMRTQSSPCGFSCTRSEALPSASSNPIRLPFGKNTKLRCLHWRSSSCPSRRSCR